MFEPAFVLSGLVSAIAGALAGAALMYLAMRAKMRSGRELAAEIVREAEVDRQKQVEMVVETVKSSFGNLSLNALGQASEQLAALARSQLQQDREASSKDLEGKKQLIDQQLKTMSHQLSTVTTLVHSLEKDREQKFGELTQRLTATNEQTASLLQVAGSLREALASSQSRGQWGERIADDILRLAGFIENVNYLKQRAIEGIGTKPDFTFLLPRNLSVNMDVKFPLANYMRMIDATTDREKEKSRRDFFADVKSRIKELGGRGYINEAQNTVDCVLLFIPHEQVFSFLQSEDPTIFDEALKQKIVCCSPMTFFAVLAVIRQAIDNFALEKTSLEILRHLGDFKKQWEKFTEKLDGLGGKIDSLQKEYESIITTRRRALERPLDRLESLRLSVGKDHLEHESDRPALLKSAVPPLITSKTPSS